MQQVVCQASQVVSDARDTAHMYAGHEILADLAYTAERVASIHIEFAQRAQLRVQEVQSAYHSEAEDAIRQIRLQGQQEQALAEAHISSTESSPEQAMMSLIRDLHNRIDEHDEAIALERSGAAARERAQEAIIQKLTRKRERRRALESQGYPFTDDAAPPHIDGDRLGDLGSMGLSHAVDTHQRASKASRGSSNLVVHYIGDAD